MKILFVCLIFLSALINNSPAYAAAAAAASSAAGADIETRVYNKFSADTDLKSTIKAFLIKKGWIIEDFADDILSDKGAFISNVWDPLEDSQKSTLYALVFPYTAAGGDGAAAAAGAASAGASGAAAPGGADSAAEVFDKFSADQDLYKKVEAYLVGNGVLVEGVADHVLPNPTAFSQVWLGLETAQKSRLYNLVFPDTAAGGDGAAAAAASAGAAAEGIPAGAVTGDLIKPEGAAAVISDAWYGIKASHLYRLAAGAKYLPSVPLLHEYNPALARIYFAGKFAPTALALPDFVTAGGVPESIYVVVMSTGWDAATLFRPHYAIHTKDDEKTKVKFAVGASDFGAVKIIGSDTVEMHTHWQEASEDDKRPSDFVASPDAGGIDFGRPAKDIKSGSFWVVATIGDKRIATFYWLVNDETLTDKLTPITKEAKTLQGLMASLKAGFPDNPQVKRLRQLLKYE
tara:strand:- start:184 stop:1563 length:1380 start_codon:yes stop_codon:yes gene_type:complete